MINVKLVKTLKKNPFLSRFSKKQFSCFSNKTPQRTKNNKKSKFPRD